MLHGPIAPGSVRAKSIFHFAIALLGASTLTCVLVEAKEGRMVTLPAGSYPPFFRETRVPDDSGASESVPPAPIKVVAFRLDVHPVTNSEYLNFVRADPRWRKGRVAAVFADGNYLKHWSAPLELADPRQRNAPVTSISWFSAGAYCKWKGRRLPTTDQWEYAAHDGGRNEDKVRQRLLEWHATPNPRVFPPVGSTPVNRHGVADLHGLVWEWTRDFNSSMVGQESREGPGGDSSLFCGFGAAGAKDTTDYPAYLRFGLRGSLKAAFTVANLGFRCGIDNKE